MKTVNVFCSGCGTFVKIKLVDYGKVAYCEGCVKHYGVENTRTENTAWEVK